MNLVSKALYCLKPVLLWINDHLSIPFSVKKVTGDHYYLWRNQINKGYVLLTNTNGQGSNLVNPSAIRHGGIYFGKGLRTALKNRIVELERQGGKNGPQIERLKMILNKYQPEDEICYVLEAVKEGFIPTNLVKFLTTKDRVKIMKPTFCSNQEMIAAALQAMDFLGLPYDFGFQAGNGAKYCFEAIAHSYEAVKNVKLPMIPTYLWGTKVYEAYRSKTFTDDKERWQCVIDSDKLA